MRIMVNIHWTHRVLYLELNSKYLPKFLGFLLVNYIFGTRVVLQKSSILIIVGSLFHLILSYTTCGSVFTANCIRVLVDDLHRNLFPWVKETGTGMSNTTSNFLEMNYETVRRNSYWRTFSRRRAVTQTDGSRVKTCPACKIS